MLAGTEEGAARRLASWGPLLLIGFGLLGCSAASRTRDEAKRSPRPGGILRIAQEAPRTLDPARVSSVYEALPVNQLFDGLVDLDESLHVTPALASTWTISRDGRVYTFQLRPGVRFHDGTPLTARDVVFTLKRVLSPDPERRGVAFSYLRRIEGAEGFAAGVRDAVAGLEAVDELTVRIHIERPYLSFLEVLAMEQLRIVPERRLLEVGDETFSRSPVGTGPFRLAEWTDDSLYLTANSAHFRGPPNLSGVRIVFLEDDEDDFGTARFDRGELDVLEVPPEHLERLGGEPSVRIHRYQELSLVFLGLLTGAPPLDELPVRQAVALAIDREALAAQSPETRRAAFGILPPGLPGYSPRTHGLGYDPDRARRLLAAAGYPAGRGLRPLRIVVTGKSAAARRVLGRIQEDLNEVGITLRVEEVGWRELSRRIQDHDAPVFLLAWVADLPDPDAFLRTLFEREGSANYFSFHDDETWRLLETGAREMNPVNRAEIYRMTERRILELAPLVPLYHPVQAIAMRRRVAGFEPGPLGLASVDLEKAWFEREAP